MVMRTSGQRRVAGNLEAGAHLLGNVIQDVGGQIFFADGTNAAPPGVFTLDTNTSAIPYRNAADRVEHVAGGNDTLSIRTALIHMYQTAVVQVAGQLQKSDGTVGAPGDSWINDPDCGGYRAGANDIRIAVNASEQLRFQTAGTQFLNHLIVSGNLTLLAALLKNGVATPAALTAGNNNDFAGLAGKMMARVTPDGGGTSVFTGFVPDGNGDEKLIWNIGAVNVAIAHQNVGSAVANRTITSTGASLVLAPDNAAYIWYDPTATRWRAELV